MDLARFRRLPLVGILRGIAADDVAPLAEAVIGAGLTTIEITMNTAGAPALIGRLRAVAGERLMVGAGTVLDLDAYAAARGAGASFIVMPTLVPAVVERCAAEHVLVFPGALTPQEIHAAWSAGATMVKVFPASVFGPRYLREVRGPFDQIELMAVGGVTADNLAEYLACGASAAAFGASVFRPQWLAARAYDRIGAEVRRLVAACGAARRGAG
ncbi:MAG: bifunctional 4-hydroxy-2-oxoglutarate aldolase/2-dehydro-3-deoxy-phosphogluconate aldolase [Candidatus Binatia bacterium]